MKAALAVIVVLILVLGLQSLVAANPRPIPKLPSTPDKSEPSIVLSLPQNNQTYTMSAIDYSLTVTKPSSWFDTMGVHGEVMFVNYMIDQSPNENQIAEVSDLYSKQPLSYKGTLTNLSEGNHTFQIKVRSCSYYNHFYDSNNSNTWNIEEYYYINTYSKMINFTVHTISQSSHIPTTDTQQPDSTPTTPEFPVLTIILLMFALVPFVVLIKNKKLQVMSTDK